MNDLDVSEFNQRNERKVTEIERAFRGPVKGSA